jgi:glycosyltransferase involved in cell wall biosynthesis
MAPVQTDCPEVSLVIPAYNEAELIDRVTQESIRILEQARIPSWEIVLVDDGSTDSTGTKMDALSARDPRIHVFKHEMNRGMGAALRTGYLNTRGVLGIWTPGDGQFDLVEIMAALPLLANNDVVYCIRRGRKGPVRNTISYCFHGMVRILFNFNATDYCGLFACRPKVLRKYCPKSDDVFFMLEFLLLCAKADLRLARIEVNVKPRLAGASKVGNLHTMAKNVYELFKCRLGL